MPVNMQMTVIGPTLNIVGEINADEKLIIEGKVSTKAINLPDRSRVMLNSPQPMPTGSGSGVQVLPLSVDL